MRYIIKIFTALIVLSLSLSASGNFWSQVELVQDKFYNYQDQNRSEADNTADGTMEAAESLRLTDKYNAFNDLILKLKSDPFGLKNSHELFYDKSSYQNQILTLSSRVAINKKHNYGMAVVRDEITIDLIKLKKHSYDFFVKLSDNWADMSRSDIEQMINKELDYLKMIDIKAYQNLDLGSQKLDLEIAKTRASLLKNYYFYRDMLNYLLLNSSIFEYRSLVQNLQLSSIISSINDNAISASINRYLRFIKLDIGRVILFLSTLLLATLVSRLTYKYLYLFLKKQIAKQHDDTDDMMSSNLESIRKPLSFLIIAFGLELAIQIIIYPSVLEQNSIFFYAIYLATIGYIIIILIDNFVFRYLLHKAKSKNRQIRSELINLLVSIAKIVVFIVALLLFLVRLDVNITGILASLGIGGLAVALAAKDTLSNFFGLIKIIADNSMSQGDWVQADGIEGTVVEIGFVSTDIRTFDNALITVPNAMLANTALKNWNRRSVGRRIKMYIGVSYNSDPVQLQNAIVSIREMLIEHSGIVAPQKYDPSTLQALKKHDKKLVSFEDKHGIKTTLLVYLDRLSDSSIDILIYAFSNTVNWQEWLEIKQDVIFKIWKILEEHDLELAFPSQTIYFDKQNALESLLLKKD